MSIIKLKVELGINLFLSLDHRTPTGHSCSKVPDCTLEELPPPNENPLFNQCQYETCFKGEIFPVLCPKCGQNYCLEHRHPIDHYCEGLQREEEMEESAYLEKQLEIEKALQGRPFLFYYYYLLYTSTLIISLKTRLRV